MSTYSRRLVQLTHPQFNRQVALVSDSTLILLSGITSIYEFALQAIAEGKKISELIDQHLTQGELDYSAIYNGESDWKLLPSFDHPGNPMNCVVSGTGLTHKSSAMNRQMMHQSANEKPTDSMQMYQWGVEGGHPANGVVGVQPEWFYKGSGFMLRGHGEALHVPSFANDGGEEPEVAGVYIVDANGTPWRIGLTTGNEFSDHIMEKKNYLYLAPSKLRNCAIGPELVLTDEFKAVEGTVSITRDGAVIWSKAIRSGEDKMAHSMLNLEHHHFKYPGHRIPLQAHVHFFGADAFSFGEQVALQHGDVMNVQWNELGRPLQNPLMIEQQEDSLVLVKSLS